MSTINLAMWNIQWMNDWFTGEEGQTAFRPMDDEVRGPKGQATLQSRIVDVVAAINALAPDAMVIVEGPNRTDELQHFFSHAPNLAGTWTVSARYGPSTAPPDRREGSGCPAPALPDSGARSSKPSTAAT
jgi:hypothetical protein